MLQLEGVAESIQVPLSRDEETIRNELRRLLDERVSQEVLRAAASDPPSSLASDLWSQLASLGLSAACIPERHGGLACGPVTLALLFEELGRSLAPTPALSSMVLGPMLLVYGATEEQKRELLPVIASGDLKLTFAGPYFGPAGPSPVAASRGPVYRLSGVARGVPEADVAHRIIVAARIADSERLSMFIVPADSPDISFSLGSALDPLRMVSTIEFENAAAQRLGHEGQASSAVESTLTLADIALSAESIGGAEGCLELVVGHVRERRQFGRPIGSFQAVKHRLATVFVQVQAAKAGSRLAARLAETSLDGARRIASVARLVSGEAFMKAAEESIQFHGGLGFTWEIDAHFYLRRARSAMHLLRPSAYHEKIVLMTRPGDSRVGDSSGHLMPFRRREA